MMTNDVLGRGGYGVVYLADFNGRNAAAKVVEIDHGLGGNADVEYFDMPQGEPWVLRLDRLDCLVVHFLRSNVKPLSPV